MNTTPTIVVLDGYTLNPGDLDWQPLRDLGNTQIYERSPANEVLARAKDADVILVNKIILSEEILAQLPNLKYIGVLATGYNNIDVKAAKSRNIPVCNVVGYASNSAAQHVFALLLELTNQVSRHHQSVLNGDWGECPDFSYTLQPIIGLVNKTIGIYGFGKIGQKVAEIALAFGMKVIAHHKHPKRDARPHVEFVGLEDMFVKSDILTLHAPLSKDNAGIINQKHLALMKSSAFFINTGRGGLVNEVDLKRALEEGRIAGAGLDVLSVEPPVNSNILIGVKNCIITPHQAWASKEARQKLLDEVVANVEAFLKGNIKNNVVD